MKGKPDLEKLGKDPSSFLEGGAVEATEKKKKTRKKGPEKFTTTIRLALDVAEVFQNNCGGNQSVFRICVLGADQPKVKVF